MRIQDLDPYLIIPKEHKVTLANKYKLSWLEDTVAIGNTAQDPDVVHSGASHIGSSFDAKKLFWFLLAIALFFSVIIGRLIYLQVLQGTVYHARAENNRQRIIPIISERGLIFDRNGIPLTQNIPNFSLAVIPQDLPKKEAALKSVIVELADITEKDVNKIAEIISKYKNYQRDSIIIEEDIPYETALKIEIASSELPGIYVHRGSKRLYIHDANLPARTAEQADGVKESKNLSLSHILGYVGKLSPEDLEEYYTIGYLPSDSIGKTGIEKNYEPFLRGIYGKKRIEVNAQGTEQQVLAEELPQSGSHVTLTIDAHIQSKLEEILQKQLTLQKKNRASAIVLNPQNGEVLAMVSYPAFDNNDFSGGIDSQMYTAYIQNEDKPLFNRAIAGTYSSGSVIKPAMASAALQEGIITAHTAFLSTGGLAIGQWFFPDWQAGGHGMTNVRKSIAWSVNTFYYMIGGGYGDFVGLGVRRITDYLSKFGFGSKLGIDIPAEADGFLPSPEWKKKIKGEMWYVGDTYNFSIGQGDFLTTPLQIASMTATIANGGTLFKPHFAKSITDQKTNKIISIDSEIIRSGFISPAHIETVRLGMYDCVTVGSCWMLRSLPFSAAGKTGTAQWNRTKDTHAWFTSFAPFENPQIVVTILVEEGGEGSLSAQPIAAEFYTWWGTYR
ncbi:MAG: penicillin-binding protein 2 [Candidatus Magasanikbacteria bacterium]|nr:penicillin-binding protein 2 [Candidatus Magasanikbacteria bacterium]